MSGVLSRRALATLLLRLLVAAGLLTLAIRLALPEGAVDLPEALRSAWRAGGGVGQALAWCALAWLLLGAGFVLGTLRFQLLLRGGGFAARLPSLFRAYVIAGFFNTLLPGTVLGDVYRFSAAQRELGRGSEVAGMVALERLLSLTALGSIGLLAAPFVPLSDADAHLVWVLMGTAGSFVIGTTAALHPRVLAWLRRLVALLGGVSERLAVVTDRALAAVAALAARPGRILRVYLLSLLIQGLAVAAVLVLAVPLDTAVAWHWYLIIVPFVSLVAVIPISIGGAGVRESLYVLLFGAVGMRANVALCLSLSVFAVSLVWSFIGFLLFALGRRRDPSFSTQPDAAA